MNKYKLLAVLNEKAGGEFREQIKDYYKKEIESQLTIISQYLSSNNLELLDDLVSELDAVIVELEGVNK